jgi:phosphatidylglycerophosphate synthase
VFIEEYLQDLRRDRFSPRAVAVYLRRVSRRVHEEIVANPSAVRSVWNVALCCFAGAFVAAAGMALAFDRRLAYDFFLQTSLWILPIFALVTLHVGWLRDHDGYRLSALNIPTVLTLLRVTLVPGIVLFLLERHFGLALALFLIAVGTDIADGWIARRFNQTTPLGTALDPLVDIVFNLAVLAGLAGAALLPFWVFLVAALRYGILLIGGVYLYVFVGPVKIYPTAFGRLTGVMMASLVALLTLLEAVNGWPAERLAPLTEVALGVLLSATVFQVLALGWYNLRMMTGKASKHGRVVEDVRWGAR